MSTYTLNNSAGDIDSALQKVVAATTTPTDGSPLMVTSGGVKAYVDTEISAINTITTANVVQSVKTGKQTITGTGNTPAGITFQDITDLSVTITPRFSNSKFLVQTDVSSVSEYNPITFRIVVDGTAVGLGDVANLRTLCTFFGGSLEAPNTSGMSYLYSDPVTAGSPLVVKIQAATKTTAAINTSSTLDPGFTDETFRGISQVMVTEIYQ
jgi:hypothetical protein